MVELIEAAARAGTPDLADDALRRLVATTAASGTDWALGIAARSRALLLDGPDAEDLYREATDRLARSRMAVDLARAHLLYGEWLRRERRRMDARTELRVAHDLFSGFGMEAFAERARVELQATGEHARKRTVGHARPAHAAGGADRAPGRPRATRTARSPPSCSSARAPSSTTCARRSASST